MKKFHGNKRENNKRKHHLYEIFDKKENTTYKYGISGEDLNSNHESLRAERQVSLFNRVVGWLRFFARVLLTDIDGRQKAEELENQYINDYQEKYGKRPRGNP